jgi:hypothetical protein
MHVMLHWACYTLRLLYWLVRLLNLCFSYHVHILTMTSIHSSRKVKVPTEDFENSLPPDTPVFFSQRPTKTSSPDRWVSDSPAANNTVLRLKEGTSASQI